MTDKTTPRRYHDRATLKSYFAAGARPTADQFGAFIDSSVIMVDEGFEKTEADGLRILTKGSSNALISFGRRGEGSSQWGLDFRDNGNNGLVLGRGPRDDNGLVHPALALRQADPSVNAEAELAANLAIGRAQDGNGSPIGARSALDVRGAVRAEGRLGREIMLPADGIMHSLTAKSLHGCVAFEVMAGVGLNGSGSFALMHAIAVNAYNPGPWPWDNLFGLKRPIRCNHAYYRRRSDRLKLCWAKVDEPTSDTRKPNDPNATYGREGHYQLRLGTRTAYDDPNVRIQAFVTRLWYDAEMTGDAAIERAGQRLVDPGGQPEDPLVP